MENVRAEERVDPVAAEVDAPGLLAHYEFEIAELALALAGETDEKCVRTLEAVNQDLADTGLAIDFLIAVLRRKFELEKVTMTMRPQ